MVRKGAGWIGYTQSLQIFHQYETIGHDGIESPVNQSRDCHFHIGSDCECWHVAEHSALEVPSANEEIYVLPL